MWLTTTERRMYTPIEDAILDAHAKLAEASRDLDAAILVFRTDGTNANLHNLGIVGYRYVVASREAAGYYVDRAQRVPLGTTNARCDALEAKHAPIALVLEDTARANGTGVWAPVDDEL